MEREGEGELVVLTRTAAFRGHAVNDAFTLVCTLSGFQPGDGPFGHTKRPSLTVA